MFLLILSIGSARDGMCSVVSGSLREMSLEIVFGFSLSLFPGVCTVLFNLGTLGRAQNVLRLGALSVPSTIVDDDSTNELNTDSLCCVCFVRVRVCVQANPPFDHSSVGAAFVEYHLSGWVLSMETLPDPCRRIVQKGLCGRVGLRQR